MYDKKGATGGNGVGPGPAMLIAGIFPAPPTLLAQPTTSSPSLIHVRPRVYMCARVCMCIYICVCVHVFCLRKWSFYSVRKFRLSAAVATLPAQRVETFRVLLAGKS